MKFLVSKTAELGETEIRLESNCHSDSLPLLKSVILRRQTFNTSTQSFALALAILSAGYCGDYFETPGVAIGSDYAEAIGVLFGRAVNVTPVNPMHRSLAGGDIAVACAHVKDEARLAQRLRGGVPSPQMSLTWSGDFVNGETRSSAESAIGMCITNMAHFTDATSASVALALIFGEDHAGRITVPAPPEGAPPVHAGLSDALRIVGVSLDFA